MIRTLPQSAVNIINQYQALEIEGKKIACPYFRNVKRIRGELRVLAGKGTPQELIDETRIFAKLRGVDLGQLNETEIRQFMITQGLGVDCSGFVMHVLNEMLKANNHLGMWKYLSLKPITNWGAKILYPFKYAQLTDSFALTSEHNATKIEIKDLIPGDLVRLRGARRGDHILIVYEVEYNENRIPLKFTYVASSPHYGDKHGVKFGEVIITDINGELKDQKWNENDEKGINWTYKGLLNEYEDNGLRRLNFYKKLYA